MPFILKNHELICSFRRLKMSTVETVMLLFLAVCKYGMS